MSKPERLAMTFARGSMIGAAIVGVLGTTGCIQDTDCGVCDPDNLVLESISGINYSNRKIHLLQGVDKGKYFIEDIGACVETDDATEAARGPDEWCKLSPLVSWQGLEFVFNNLLDPTSIELVRKDPSNPQLFQIYDWKTQLAEIRGPITRFNGDYFEQTGDEPDLMLRSVNLSCIDNLRDHEGQDFNHEILDMDPEICNGVFEIDDRTVPLKMRVKEANGDSPTMRSYRGETDWRAASCTAPDSGPDTCCTVCDYELSVNVAKYGVDGSGTRRTPANALTCTAGGNVYQDCRDFVPSVNRDAETNRYSYEWDGAADTFRLPKSDKIRETHPDDRPAGIEPDGVPCQTDADCDARLGSDSGAACVGVTSDTNETCDANTDNCIEKHCKAEWFVTCKETDVPEAEAFCVDRRFKDKGAGACYTTTAAFQSCEPQTDPNIPPVCRDWSQNNRLALCDAGEFPDGNLSAVECCQASLGGAPGACDPLFQDEIVPVARFDRDNTLPEETRDCYCGDPANQNPDCAAQIDQFCTAPWGDLERHDGSSNEGHYITRFVSKVGGVIYDPALKGVMYLPGDRGNEPRSLVEACAELAVNPDLVEGLNTQDGWRMHDSAFYENYENFDRAMCSGSTYQVVFSTEGERIRDRVGNELSEDETTYTFQTPEFHVVPGTGFPTDNLRIGACDDFEIRLSNKYDLDPNNLKKIKLVQLKRKSGVDQEFGESCETSLQPDCWTEEHTVAGGINCTEDPTEVNGDTPPCLTVDVSLQREGSVRVVIDDVRFGVQLFNEDEDNPSAADPYGREISGRYRMKVPGLEVDSFDDLVFPRDIDIYNAAFHDACGMPLVTEGGGRGGTKASDFYYDFTIDPPKCKEDQDGDDVQLSCDNAREHYNPLQGDMDLDGFGDVKDLCQLTPSDSDTADSDKDGLGNDCDTCRQTINKYNIEDNKPLDPRMWVRNVPFQFDFDQDGIGDVCDNCVTVENCGVFGPNNPHTVGVPVPYEDTLVCQSDTDTDMIGDACLEGGLPIVDMDNAAGPVGFDATDDFDQDGIINLDDYCPRQPVAQDYASRLECTDDADCPGDIRCAMTAALNGVRYCNHADADADQVGDICDTCPYSPNPGQVTDGGMQVDDEDEDFVGAACETNAACSDRKDPRPYAFMDVAVDGQCCVTTYPGDGEYVMKPDGSWGCQGLCDLDGFPIQLNCDNEAVPGDDVPDGSKCRAVPSAVTLLPGVVNLAPGCEQALTDAGMCAPAFEGDPNCPPDMANRRLTLLDVPNEDELWDKMCFLPQWDQDFDGIGDACDLCKFSYDPFNEVYVDENTGKVWDNIGRFCAGQYAPDAICAAEDEDEGETGTTGGDETTG